jgi:hypothetical protein
MKCDACDSAKNVGDYRAGLNQVCICNDCFEKSHIAIAAKINTRKNEEIEKLRALSDAHAQGVKIMQIEYQALLGERKALKDMLMLICMTAQLSNSCRSL